MKLAQHLEEYISKADEFLRLKHPEYTRELIATGRDAWTVAHRAGITRHAYGLGRDVNDAHIQTVLERVFPNAVFRDPKRY